MKRAVVLSVVLAARVASADEPAPEPAPVPEVAPTPPGAVDAPEVDARYKEALDDFASGKFAAAAAAFEDVAAHSVIDARKTTAAEMARQAHARVVVMPEASEASKSRDARYVLLIGTSVMGLGLYGPTLPIVADAHDKAAVGLYMIGAGSSFLLPYLITRDEPVTWGMADAWWYGSTRGAVHGLFVRGLGGETGSTSDVMTSLSLGSAIEGTAFTLWARQTHASAGLTKSMGNGADFGVGFGLGLTSLVLPDSDLKLRWASITGLVGSGVGYGAGYLYGRWRDPTWGDGEVLRTAGAVGAYAAVVPLILAGSDHSDNRQLIVGTLVAGGAAGLVAGDHLLRGHHFSVGQGIITELATLAGAGAGAGLGYLISPNDNSSAEAKIVATGAILGAVGGFALTYLGLDTTVAPSTAAPSVSLHVVPDITPQHRGLTLAGSF